MKSAEWQEVKDLFAEALRLTVAERPSWFASRPENPEIIAEVESLLSVYDRDPEFLEEAKAELATDADPPPLSPLEGRRIGQWVLTREIARGGMGVVWEAQRADGEYEQRVAVKLLPCGHFSTAELTRFREERQILARLNHPGIARMLDGGAADDGSPYLVMEYVEGERLDTWSQAHQPVLRERLTLFQSVCAAVEYAHRHLVIHRDLKPPNILVTPDGSPKLLDFGIAKLLDIESGKTREATRTGLLLTPQFASPEQIRGESVSTATDVYSLGVVLYLLVAGRPPYHASVEDPLAAMRAVCEQDVQPPSALAATGADELHGELDAIVLQCLRKNPEERYPSVRALADDIGAWLEGRPISAHQPGWWKRAAKFLRRNRIQSAAAAAVLLSILGGSAVSVWYARSAEHERRQAEVRFNQVHRLAKWVVFDMHDAIQDLPGSTPARKLLVQRALEYLNELEHTKAGGDRNLDLDIAAAYIRIGNLQGHPQFPNLGDVTGAEASYSHARQIARALVRAQPNDERSRDILSEADTRLGGALWLHGDLKRRLELGKESAAIALDKAKRNPQKPVRLAQAYFRVAENLLMAADFQHAAPAWRRAIEAYQQSAAQDAADYATAEMLGISHQELGEVDTGLGDWSDAVEQYSAAASIFERLLQMHAQGTNAPLRLASALMKLGHAETETGRLTEALEHYRRSLAIWRQARTDDPANIQSRVDEATAFAGMASLDEKMRHRDRAVNRLHRAASGYEASLQIDPNNRWTLQLYRDALVQLGDLLTKRGSPSDWSAAAAAYQRAADVAARIEPGLIPGDKPPDTADLILRSIECRKRLGTAPKP